MEDITLTISKITNRDVVRIIIKKGRIPQKIEIDKNDFVDALFGLAEVPVKELINNF